MVLIKTRETKIFLSRPHPWVWRSIHPPLNSVEDSCLHLWVLTVHSLQTWFHSCELIIFNTRIFSAFFAIQLSAFEIECAITSLVLLESPFFIHPQSCLLFSYHITFMTVDYLVINSCILIFFYLLFPANELLPLTAKKFTLQFMALHVALLHFI